MELSEKAMELIAANRRKKNLSDDLAALENAITDMEKELYLALTDQGLEELDIGGYVLKPVMKFTASAKDEKTIRVLRRRGFGKLVKPTIHPSTAHAFIRKLEEEHGGKLPQWITDNFKIVYRETISLRRE